MKKTLLACVLAALSGLAAAQSFPSKPIRILVSSPPGSSPDLRARQIGAHLAESFGQPVIVENRPGANGLIAARETVRSGPDGYTLFLAIINNAIGDALKPDPCCRLNYELVPISRFTMTPLVMVVNASVSVKTVKEFIALAKAKPDALTYGSGGPASISQLVGEWVKSESGIKVLEVPYKGVNAEIPDLLSGTISAAYVVPQVITAHIKSGKLRALAIAGPSRLALLPDVPTTAEAGFKNVLSDNWYGLCAPAGVPPDVLDKLHKVATTALRSAEVKKQLEPQDAVPSPTSPSEYVAFVKSERAKWEPVVIATGTKLE